MAGNDLIEHRRLVLQAFIPAVFGRPEGLHYIRLEALDDMQTPEPSALCPEP
jgi:hypothetical protein